ncbi:MAG: hypothetical protein WBQ21_05075 [Solirubrobacteraceae bacterium]
MLKMEVKYEGSDGREYRDAGSMIRSGVDRILEEKFSKAERAAMQSTCAEHGQRASVRREKTADGVDFKIRACCEKHVKAAREAAQRAIAD